MSVRVSVRVFVSGWRFCGAGVSYGGPRIAVPVLALRITLPAGRPRWPSTNSNTSTDTNTSTGALALWSENFP